MRRPFTLIELLVVIAIIAILAIIAITTSSSISVKGRLIVCSLRLVSR